MAMIRLTKGFVTLVDDKYFIELNSFNWYAAGPINDPRPARRMSDSEAGPRKLIFLYHQVLGVYPWELSQSGLVVDHINNNALDNTIANLRIVSQTENMRNASRHLNRLGVSVDRTHNTFKAYIDNPDKKRINLGTFKTREEAEHVVLEFRKKEAS